MVRFDYHYHFLFRRFWIERKTSIEKKNLRLLKVKFKIKKNNSFCHVSTINAALDASIVNSSIEQKVFTYGFPVLQINPTTLIRIGRRHRGRSTTPRNQQHENFLQNDSFSFFFFRLGLIKMVGKINIHLVRTLDTRITIEDCWSD